ncbi:hypothetical protein KIN20_024970 [Parelaphostrongylus tenuis]|uniref:SEFIR domain-containing protein n=1 Tax=Parelaphostrongylus tenuis TaxID=148309 RepID=A0AAD5QU07_PARTN|nr:hypothetical protein KIN20_024970 [Parelaphostrongylus tenuis]
MTVDSVTTVPLMGSKPVDISSFQSDCSDPHNKEITCSVHVVDCAEKLFEDAAPGQEPPEAHDVRIEAFAKAMARREHHQLHVDVSWQISPKRNSMLLKAFKLQITDSDGSRCFVFNVSDFRWIQDLTSPRFHFTSESLFKFSGEYRIALYSLPQSSHRAPVIIKESKMPGDPEFNYDDDQRNISQYCKTHTNTEASKWTAAFRRIVLQSITRTIQVEFVGAPPHFCFEEYEVRLLDETGIELLYHANIKAKDMRKEVIDGKVLYFGEYNFTGLEYGVDYIPSVIPVEMSSDGRCLCPTSEQHGACSCIAADWKRVRLQRVDKPTPAINYTIPTIIHSRDENMYWPIYVVVIALCLLFALCAIISVLLMFYRKYTKHGKSVRIRFISDHSGNNGTVSAEPRAPLIYNYPTSVLIIYSHDCPQHDAAVLALAELLRDTFKMDVHLDVWDEEIIEKNLYDYVNSSIIKADKIIVINSIGSYHRVRARYLGEETVERVEKSPLDGIFLSQIDLVLQHAHVVSARFSYTPSTYTLFALSPLLQYTIPENLGLFVVSLSESQLRNDPRLAGYDPQLSRLHTAIATMTQLIESDPKWFQKSHHRVRRVVTKVAIPVTDSMSKSASHAMVASSTLEGDAKPLLDEEDKEQTIQETQSVGEISAFNTPFAENTELEHKVCEKPRLAHSSADDTPHLEGDEIIAEPPLGRKNDVIADNDSGMVSDLTSGQLSV